MFVGFQSLYCIFTESALFVDINACITKWNEVKTLNYKKISTSTYILCSDNPPQKIYIGSFVLSDFVVKKAQHKTRIENLFS